MNTGSSVPRNIHHGETVLREKEGDYPQTVLLWSIYTIDRSFIESWSTNYTVIDLVSSYRLYKVLISVQKLDIQLRSFWLS